MGDNKNPQFYIQYMCAKNIQRDGGVEGEATMFQGELFTKPLERVYKNKKEVYDN